MNLLTLSSAFLRANPLNSLLNLLLLALGMGTIVMLLLVSQQLEERLWRDARGIDLVIGAKGSPLQLILSSIYHTDVPTGNIPLSEVKPLMTHRMVKTAIPLALGDNYHGYRIVGTTSAYPAHYQASLAQGRFWKQPLEATLGAEVAQQTGLKISDHFVGSHGLTYHTDFKGHIHEQYKYTVVGLLKPTGTVIDRLILTDMETVWQVHEEQHEAHTHEHEHEAHADEHEHEAETDEHKHEADTDEHEHEEPAHEITALLIRYQSPLATVSFPRMVNSQSALQAASPAYETARLLQLVGFGIDTLRAFGILLIFMATLSMFIALYHSLAERRYDLAIMRTLGASKARLLWQLLFEGILLALLGSLLGLLFGHVVTEMLGLWLNQSHQLQLTGWAYVISEAWLLILAILIGTASALLPAIQAYRVDIAHVLSQG
jgi:putative ABC transport system permease protein